MSPPAESLAAAEYQRLVALRMQLLELHPFWGFLLLPMVFEPAELEVPMTTDFIRHIWYDPQCTKHLNFRKLGYVLIHQVCHLAYGTMGRQNRRVTLLWHQATDHAINRVIENMCKASLDPPYENPATRVHGQDCFVPLYDPRFGNHPAEVIYEILFDEMMQESEKEPGSSEGQKNAGAVETGSGEAEEGGEGEEGEAEEGKKGDKEGQKGKPVDGNRGKSKAKGDGEETPESSGNEEIQASGPPLNRVVPHGSGIDIHLPIPENEEFREKLQERLVDAYERWEQSGSRGSVPAEIGRLVNQVRGFGVNWRRLFHQFVDPCLGLDELSLSRPNRRWLMQDMLVPGSVAEKVPFLVVSVDTSGSMSTEVMDATFRELERLADLVQECLLLVGDAKIHDIVPTDKLEEFFKKRTLRGGGGTSHLPVFSFVERMGQVPSLFVGVTDLFSVFPERPPQYPVLWVVPPVHGQVPFGRKLVVIP